jgi:hypothetical protein
MVDSETEVREILRSLPHDQASTISSSNQCPFAGLPVKTRIAFAVIGLFTGLIAYIPLAALFMMVAFIASGLLGGSSIEPEAFMPAGFCFIPSAFGSLMGGLVGGEIGSLTRGMVRAEIDYNPDHGFIGAFVGGLATPIALLTALSALVLQYWAR